MKARYTVSSLAAAVAFGAAACGSNVGTPTTTGIPITQQAAPTSAATPAATLSIGAIWCALTIGESKKHVLAAMPAPRGDKAAAYIIARDELEWDTDNDIFLASFVDAKASNLQAYAGSVGPVGATDISCAAFRH
jgi:hypothetical protein